MDNGGHMVKIFISQKMRDLTEEEILRRRNMIIDLIKKDYVNDNVEIIESWHPDFDKNSIAQLGQSIIEMSEANIILLSEKSIDNIVDFMGDAQVEHIKGSEIEAFVCLSYKIPYRVYILDMDLDGKVTGVRWLEKNK